MPFMIPADPAEPDTETPANQPPANRNPANQTPTDRTPANQITANQITANQPTAKRPAVTKARKLEINFVVLAAGEFLAKICTFLAFSHLARTLGPERYGSIEFVLALMVFFSLMVDFGLGHYGTREVARNPEIAPRFLRQIVGLRLLLAGVSFLVLWGLVLVLHKPAEVELLLCIYGLSLFGGPFLLQWFFQAHDRMGYAAIVNALRQFVFAACVLALFRAGTPLYAIGVMECVSVLAAGLFGMGLLRFGLGVRAGIPELRGTLAPHWKQALPIGMTEMAWAFTWYFSTVILGLIYAKELLGWFGASHRLLMALHTFVFLYFFNLLPSISRCAERPVAELRELMSYSMRFAVWTGVFAGLLLTVLSHEIVILAYGELFREAQASIMVLGWILPLAMLGGHHRFILIAYRRQDKLLVSTVASALLAIAGGLALVPLYGDTGAAWALLLANVLQFALAYYYVRKYITRISFLRHLWEPLFALSVSFVLFFSLKPWLHPWVVGILAGCVYGALMLWFNGREALSVLRTLMGRNSPAPAMALSEPAPVAEQP
jgi:O-antigen/teichoic acid export membrane protein